MRAIENNQYVNGSTDTDAGADCRLIIRLNFVIFFLIIFVEVCIRCIYMKVTSTELLNRSVGLSIIS